MEVTTIWNKIYLTLYIIGSHVYCLLLLLIFEQQKCLTEVRDSNVVILQKNDILKTEIWSEYQHIADLLKHYYLISYSLS
jgi:hypothetical protein